METRWGCGGVGRPKRHYRVVATILFLVGAPLSNLWMGMNTEALYWLQNASYNEKVSIKPLSFNNTSDPISTSSISSSSSMLFDDSAQTSRTPPSDNVSVVSNQSDAQVDGDDARKFASGDTSAGYNESISKSSLPHHHDDDAERLQEPSSNVSNVDSITTNGISSIRYQYDSLQALTGNPPNGTLVCPSAYMVPIYDKIVEATTVNNNNNPTRRKIPRIIHVSFNQRCIPQDMANAVGKWQQALPDHSFYFHDDDAVDRLLHLDWPDFPQLHRLLACVKFKGAMKIDIWRILVLYKYGGLYTDIDNWPMHKFDTGTIHDDDTFFSLSDSYDRPSQWLFAMEPGHPIGRLAMQEIMKRIQRMKNIAKPHVVQITGPQALKRAYMNYLSAGTTNIDDRSNVRKIGLEDSRDYAAGSLGGTFDDVVEFNGINMTIREKVEQISGIVHWPKQIKESTLPYQGSCLDYLAWLDGQSLNTTVNGTVGV